MKLTALPLIACLWCGCAISAESSADAGGSNIAGAEKVCMLSNASDEAFKSSVEKCRRGDILALGQLTNLGAMKLCDFTKTIMFEKGSPVACVYTGATRPATK